MALTSVVNYEVAGWPVSHFIDDQSGAIIVTVDAEHLFTFNTNGVLTLHDGMNQASIGRFAAPGKEGEVNYQFSFWECEVSIDLMTADRDVAQSNVIKMILSVRNFMLQLPKSYPAGT